MSIGHAAGIVVDFGVPVERAHWGPMLTNLVYIGFALSAGILCDWITGRRVIIGIAAIMAIALFALYFAPSASMSLIALALVGGSFGASASAYPVTVANYYGVSALPRIYGRLATSFGLAGLLGPLVAGVLYDMEGRYNYSILIAAALALCSVGILWTLPKSRVAAQSG